MKVLTVLALILLAAPAPANPKVDGFPKDMVVWYERLDDPVLGRRQPPNQKEWLCLVRSLKRKRIYARVVIKTTLPLGQPTARDVNFEGTWKGGDLNLRAGSLRYEGEFAGSNWRSSGKYATQYLGLQLSLNGKVVARAAYYERCAVPDLAGVRWKKK